MLQAQSHNRISVECGASRSPLPSALVLAWGGAARIPPELDDRLVFRRDHRKLEIRLMLQTGVDDVAASIERTHVRKKEVHRLPAETFKLFSLRVECLSLEILRIPLGMKRPRAIRMRP